MVFAQDALLAELLLHRENINKQLVSQFFGLILFLICQIRSETLSEAQRTQAIESKTIYAAKTITNSSLGL